MKIKTVTLLIILLAETLSAQTHHITGIVTDSQSEPLPFANVLLLNDSTFIEGTVTDENGGFILKKSTEGNRVRVSMVGFEDFYSEIPADGNLDTIMLRPSSKMLEEVIVKSAVPRTRITGNGLSTTVANSVLADAGTANDVLSKIPLVTGSDGEFTVFGRGTPLIYINSRRVSNTTELQQLKSSDIRSVEVISNPGSKYPADATAVIIIKTVPPKGEGFSVSVFNSTRIASHVMQNNDLSLKYRQGALEIFADGFFYGGKRKFDDITTMYTYGNQTTCQNLAAKTLISSHRLYGKFGFNHIINDRHSFGAYYKYGNSRMKQRGTISSDISLDGVLQESFMQNQKGNELEAPIHDANAYYNGSIGNLDIDFNTDFMKRNQSKNSVQTESGVGPHLQKIATDAFDTSRMWAEKLTLSYPIWKGNFELGEEYTGSRISHDASYSGVQIKGGDVTINEKNIAAFAAMRQTLGRFQLGLGVRFEHTVYDYFDGAKQNHDVSRRYNDWYPSVSVSTRIGNVSLALNASGHTDRPAYSQLDGTVLYLNRYTYQNGNPGLQSSRIYTAQIMAQWRYLFAQTLYSHEKNAIFSVARNYDSNQEIKLVTFENVPDYRSLQIVCGVQPTIGCWSPQATAGLFCNFHSERFRDGCLRLHQPYFFLQWNNAVELPHDWTIDADMMGRSAGYSRNIFLKAAGYVNLGVRKSFCHDSLSIGIQANDIFNTNTIRNIIYSGDIKITGEHRQESRNIVITLSYDFNSTESKYKGSGAGSEERKRF